MSDVDYKLAARVVACRLLKVFRLIVVKDQTCGVPGRFIGENVCIIRDVVSFASRAGVPLDILSLDQEKAFDRVDWGFMRATLSSCLLYTSPSPRDLSTSRMPSSA